MKHHSLISAQLLFLLTLTAHTTASAQEPYVVKSSDRSTITFYYDNSKASRAGTVYGINDHDIDTVVYSHPYSSWANDRQVKNVVFDSSFKNYTPDHITNWFWYLTGITTIDFTNLNTSKLENLDWAFYGCSGLKALDLSNWDTSHLNSCFQAFQLCTNLTSLNLSGWKVSDIKATSSFKGLFWGCQSLKHLDLTGWEPKNALTCTACSTAAVR